MRCLLLICLSIFLLVPAPAQGETPTPTPVITKAGQIIYKENDSLIAINADGSRRQALAFGQSFVALCPAWSRDGRQIAFVGGASEFSVYSAAATGGTPRAILQAKPPLTDPPVGIPAWSPDSKSVAFTGQSGALYFLTVAGSKFSGKLDMMKFLSVDWSPDGKALATFAIDSEGQPGVFTLDIDGSNVKKRAALSESDLKAVLTGDHFFTHDTVLPRWSPDGTQLAYAALDKAQISQIYVLDLASDTSQQVRNGTINAYAPSWSSDGKTLAYMTENGGERTIDLLDLGQNRNGTLTAFRIGGCPVWKPTK